MKQILLLIIIFSTLTGFSQFDEAYYLEAQPGFESATKFSNWIKTGAGTFTRTNTGSNRRSGSFYASLTGNLSTGANIYNTKYSVTTPETGVNYVTVIAWARRSGSVTAPVSLGIASSEETIGTSGLGTVTPGTSWGRVSFTFPAQNNTTYFPVIFVTSNSTSTSTLWLDDVVVYTSNQSTTDLTNPSTVAYGFKIDVVGDKISFDFTKGNDAQTGLDRTVIVRFDGVTNQNGNPPAASINTLYSTSTEIGPNLLSGGKVVYAGPPVESWSETVSTDIMTYLIYEFDKALNGTAFTSSTRATRVIILKDGKNGKSGANNFTCAAIWIGPGSTYEILGSATMNFADNGVEGGSSVYGTMHQNTGNINPRNNSSANLVYKNGGAHINSRPNIASPDGNYLPRATWEEGSTAIVDGRKPAGMGGTGQKFWHFIWNTSSLETDLQLEKGFGVLGDFTIYSTKDNITQGIRTLYMPDTTMEIGGNLIIDDETNVKIEFPGPAGDQVDYGPGNNLKFVGRGDQMLTNNNVSYDLFSVDVSKPSGSLILQQDLRLRGGLNYDSGTIAWNDFKLYMVGQKGNAAMPQYISGDAPLTVKEVIINNTNNEPVLAKRVQNPLDLKYINLPDSNYVVTSNNLTISEKLTMISGKLIVQSKTLTLPKTIEYNSSPKKFSEGGANNFFGGRNTGNLQLTGNLDHLLFWGDIDNEIDTFRLNYSSPKTATIAALDAIFTKNLLIEDNATMINTLGNEERFIWVLDSLFIKNTATLSNERSKVPILSATPEAQNGFGFVIGGNARIDGEWLWEDPLGSNSRVLFKGTKNQTLSGDRQVSFYNMEVDNPAELNIMNATTVSKKLILTNGLINTNKNYTFLMQPEAVAYKASDSSFLNGPMVRNLNMDVLGITLLNPVGKKGASNPYRPVLLNLTDIEDPLGFSMEYFPGKNPINDGIYTSAFLSGVNQKEYWEIGKASTYARVPVSLKIGLKYIKPENTKWAPILPDEKDKVGITHGNIVNGEINWSLSGEEEPGFSIREEGEFKNAGSWAEDSLEIWTPPVSSFSPFGFGFFGSKLILPVELRFFKVIESNGKPLLNWEIASSTDLLQFEIEHSTNGTSFSSLQIMVPNGITYQFIHQQALKGIHYYRLKWKEKDGKEKYSSIQSVALGKDQTEVFAVGPVPFQHLIKVLIWSKMQQNASYSVFDQSGKIVRSGKLNLQKGSNNLTLNDLETLSKGSYYLKIQFAEGISSLKPIMK